jgi:hypothetical protein
VEDGQLGVHDALKLARLDNHDHMREVWRLFLDRREDAWITSVEQAITEHADRVRYQERRRAALEVASAEGVPVVDPVAEFGRDLISRRLTSLEQVRAARTAGTLVAGVSADGELVYYTTGAPATDQPGPAEPAVPDASQRRAAAAARERAGRLLAAHPPVLPATAAPMVDGFLRLAPDRWQPIARRWLRWLRLGPGEEMEPARWWRQICAADWETRVWAAHCLALAGSEHRTRTRDDWDDTDLAWLWRLVTEAGYVPSSWERHRLAASGGVPGRQLPGDR